MHHIGTGCKKRKKKEINRLLKHETFPQYSTIISISPYSSSSYSEKMSTEEFVNVEIIKF